MDLIPLIGANLKGDAIINLLELWDCDVIYDFDRLHEGTPDQYWVSVYGEGLQFLFDNFQKLKCIFVHVKPTDTDGLRSANLADTDIPRLNSIDDVRAYAESNGLQLSEGQAELFDQARDWVRIEYINYSIHYEFRNGLLGLVTVSSTS